MLFQKEKIDLQVHPYFENYSLNNIARYLENNDVGIVGLVNYNRDSFSPLENALKKEYPEYIITSDSTAIRILNINNGKETYLLRGIEVMNSENLQLVVIGNIKGIVPYRNIKKNIEIGVKNKALVIMDHPFADADHEYRSITSKKKEELEDIAREFDDEIVWEWNSYCIPWIRKTIEIFMASSPINEFLWDENYLGADVNKELENFALEMKNKGYNVNIVADSDIHARTHRALKSIGKVGHIKVERSLINYMSGKKIIESLKNSIKKGENVGYENFKNMFHFHIF